MSYFHFTRKISLIESPFFSRLVHYPVLIELTIYEISDLIIGQKMANGILVLLDWTFVFEGEVSMALRNKVWANCKSFNSTAWFPSATSWHDPDAAPLASVTEWGGCRAHIASDLWWTWTWARNKLLLLKLWRFGGHLFLPVCPSWLIHREFS